MTTPAVTETVPATVTETPEQEVSLQERLNNATDEEYGTWERTGEFPAIKPKAVEPPKTETPAVSKEPSATETVETKPTEKVETAPATESGTRQKKKSGDARILQLLEERKQEREEFQRRLDDMERRIAKPADASVKADSQPTAGEVKASDPEPDLAGINPKTGKPFATIAEWQKVHTEWLRAGILSEVQGTLTKSDQEKERQKQEREFADRLMVGKEKHPDFEEVAFNPDMDIPNGSAVDMFIRQSANPEELLYYLGKNPEVLKSFYRYVPGKDDRPGHLTGVFEQLVHPNLQLIQLARIEASLSAQPVTVVTPKPSAPATPKLPPPPTVLSAKGNAAGDPTEEAIKNKNFADYEKAANESERRARGASRR